MNRKLTRRKRKEAKRKLQTAARLKREKIERECEYLRQMERERANANKFRNMLRSL